MLVIPAPGRLKQVDFHKFEVSLGHIAGSRQAALQYETI